MQRRIKAAYNTRTPGLQIVIYGKMGHAEVNGLVGQTNGEAIVVENIDGLDQIDFTKPIALYSQTTKSIDGLRLIVAEIERRRNPDVPFSYYDTICRQVSNRVSQLRAFAASHEIILFVSGTHLIAGPQEIDRQWLEGVNSTGICGATSTPRWLMEDVREAVLEMCR